MARAATIGNGNILVGLDSRGQVRDFYSPFVGHASHVSGASGSFVHRIGVYADGRMSWFDDPQWEISMGCDINSAIGCLSAHNQDLGITLTSRDVVHNERNVFIRNFTLINERTDVRDVRLFLSQQFRISESRRGDTGYFDPRVNAIIHYKGHQAFLINAFEGERQFSEYNIGLFGIEGREGTYLDANDGQLSQNPIEHGSVDSVIGIPCTLAGRSSTQVHYWIAVGNSIPETHKLNQEVLNETPDVLIKSTEHYWKAWIGKEKSDLSLLGEDLQSLYRRSLLTIRVHADNRGGIIASSDTDMLHHGRDTYSYVWPRDGAMIAAALDRTGYVDVTQRFFKFMSQCLEPDGYLMHKYRVDGVLGSSWHPWIRDGKEQLPIQEDETALVLVKLWEHYERHRDLEFIESLYNPFLEPVAEFLCDYIDPQSGLPEPSYDLWEEKYGTATFTASAVFAALSAAGRFAILLGKDDAARTYQAIAERMQESIVKLLYDEELGMFVKHVTRDEDGELVYDRTIDTSSFYGPFAFGVLEADDPRIVRSCHTIKERLQVHGDAKGFVRYAGDGYYKMHDAETPNPWVVTTLWMAQYYIKTASNEADLAAAYELLEWTCAHAAGSGMLAEQMHPDTGAHLSTAPLIWSHAEYVVTVNEYLKKRQEFTDT